jgi:Xaa-Pro aminopeptidase
MPTAEGCRARRERLLDLLKPPGPILFGDPINLRYLAGFYVDPISIGADFGGLLQVLPDGTARLFHDHRLPQTVQAAHVDERHPVRWYDGVSPGHGPRRMVLQPLIDSLGTVGRVHDELTDPLAPQLFAVLGELRRVKQADEIDTIGACCRAAEAGHAWARANVYPGMTELDVYAAVLAECCRVAGEPVIVYGDFAVSPGSSRRGGPPTRHVIEPGEMLILDYSVVIAGYRCDFTNTLVVGAEPKRDQRYLYDLCVAAMAEGERHLRPGVTGKEIYGAVRGVFDAAGVADYFPHHAGHGLGLSHPEAPFLVSESEETLVAGDVVTLEPGLYIDGIGGLRIEHNYLITDTGFHRLSGHELALT